MKTVNNYNHKIVQIKVKIQREVWVQMNNKKIKEHIKKCYNYN